MALMIALDPDFSTSEAPLEDASLSLAAATAGSRGYLVVHFPPMERRFSSAFGDVAATAPERLAELEQDFVSELRELGGMAVVA
jgi:hypothetical protein